MASRNKNAKVKILPPPSFYELLGVSPHADVGQLQRNWLDMEPVIKNDKKKYELGKRAYEFLQDTNKREWYGVMTELDDLDLPNSCGSAYNVSKNMHENQHIQKYCKLTDPCKNGEEAFQVNVTLEDVYTGKTVNINIKRHIICSGCPGSLGKINLPCPQCTTRQHWRAAQHCNRCGNRRIVQDNCRTCKGIGSTKEDMHIPVNIKKGSFTGMKIRFPGLGNRLSVTRPADDVVIALNQTPHAKFQRQGAHLFTTHVLKLSQVLCSEFFVFQHLDGRKLKVNHSKVNITPGCTMVIKDEGLPIPDRDEKGDLIISFDIEFPSRDDFTLEQIKTMKEIFPTAQSVSPQETAEKMELKDIDMHSYSDRKIPPIFDEKYPGHRMFPLKDPSNCPVQ